ncbi:hypothetical protein BDN67DRAFT_965712 [Paxillus ammoniavirescens]|nr:hypothetical protein BDN67DRAFT_965712 [Paxillus ammoniavirescens]
MSQSQVSNAITYIARRPRSLLSILTQSPQGRHGFPVLSQNQILLFALAPSSSTSPELLAEFTSTLAKLFPTHVGCISTPLPHQYLDPKIHRGSDWCSLSYTFVNGVSFRSTIPGRAEPQVGRWHAGRRRSEEHRGLEQERIGTSRDTGNTAARVFSDASGVGGEIDWEMVWDRSARAMPFSSPFNLGSGRDLQTLPDALKNLDPSTIDNIFYFSDRAPEGIASVLEGVFPQANKLALIASSTPFLTGRPVTLFHNGKILSDGAVGIALTSSPSSPPPVVELSFPPLDALSPDLEVTSSEGNLILSLNSGNPTQLLLAAIHKHGLSISGDSTWVGKEDQFYVGIVDTSSDKLTQLHRINSGDPSRGTIALDTASAPREGSVVRLYHLPRYPTPGASAYIPDPLQTNVSLFVAPELLPDANSEAERASGTQPDGRTKTDDLSIIPDAFLVASENGFTLSRGSDANTTLGKGRMQGPWTCVVPGGRVGLSWTKTS